MIIEIILICLFGTFLHFAYEISHHNKVVALFAAVNESTWEHIKIALTATFLASIYDYAKFGLCPNFAFAKFLGLLSIIVLIPLIFYTYTYFTKKAILVVDVSYFYLSIIISNQLFYKFINMEDLGFVFKYYSTIGIFLIFAFYMVATLMPVKNFMFKDPNSHKYGLKGHTEMEKHEH